MIIKWTIIITIPVGVVNLLIFTIQQIVAKRHLTKKRRIINKNLLNIKFTDYVAVHFLFYKKKHILLIVLNDCKIIKKTHQCAGIWAGPGAGANNLIV